MPASALSDGPCLCGICVLDTIARVAAAAQGTPRRRKILFFIGSDMVLQSAGTAGVPSADVGCEIRLKDARNAMFAACLDPAGRHRHHDPALTLT